VLAPKASRGTSHARRNGAEKLKSADAHRTRFKMNATTPITVFTDLGPCHVPKPCRIEHITGSDSILVDIYPHPNDFAVLLGKKEPVEGSGQGKPLKYPNGDQLRGGMMFNALKVLVWTIAGGQFLDEVTAAACTTRRRPPRRQGYSSSRTRMGFDLVGMADAERGRMRSCKTAGNGDAESIKAIDGPADDDLDDGPDVSGESGGSVAAHLREQSPGYTGRRLN